MTEVRKGRQTPTRSVVLPYTSTLGGEAIELYNSTGRTAQEWQELLVSDILAYNEDGLWIHTKYGYSVPRTLMVLPGKSSSTSSGHSMKQRAPL